MTDSRWIVVDALECFRRGDHDGLRNEVRRAVELLPRHTTKPIDQESCRRFADAIVEYTGCARPALLPPSIWMPVAATLNQRGWKRFQRILGYCGQFRTAVLVYRKALQSYPRRLGAATGRDRADERLHCLVRGTVPLLVGKSNARAVGEWTRGPIVRLNVLNLPSDDQAAPCDVLYLNSGQQQRLDARMKTDEQGARHLIARVKLLNVGSASILAPAAKRFQGGSPELPFGGALTGIRAIHDMLHAGAKSVHLVGFDFYLTAVIRKPNHEMCAQLGSAVIWGQLDWVQSLYRRGLVTADAAGRAVLEMSLEEYAEKLETLYSDWSNEITNV